MNPLVEPLFTSLRSQIASSPSLSDLDLVSLARPSVRLATQRMPYAQIGLGESRIGGVPDVPPGFEWPRWLPSKPRNDKFAQPWRPNGSAPLGFIAQIDLSNVPHVDNLLPASGWLYFFYDRYCEPWGFDPVDRGCCRIVYVNCDHSHLERVEPPVDSDPDHVAEACLVEAWPGLTLPDYLPSLEYGTPEYDAYRAICDLLTKSGGNTHHHLLGHPQLIQNPMELECQLASNGVYCGDSEGYQSERARSLEHGAADWRLVLQIDTDEDGPGWMWGDVGRIYFWVKEQDLRSLRFDDSWLILQCC